MPTCDQSAAWPRGPSYAISRSSAGFCTRCAPAALCKINQEDVIRYIERHAQVGAREQARRCAGRCAPFSVTSTIGG